MKQHESILSEKSRAQLFCRAHDRDNATKTIYGRFTKHGGGVTAAELGLNYRDIAPNAHLWFQEIGRVPDDSNAWPGEPGPAGLAKRTWLVKTGLMTATEHCNAEIA